LRYRRRVSDFLKEKTSAERLLKHDCRHVCNSSGSSLRSCGPHDCFVMDLRLAATRGLCVYENTDARDRFHRDPSLRTLARCSLRSGHHMSHDRRPAS